MNDSPSDVIEMKRHAIRPRDIAAFLAESQATARRLVSAELYADQIEFGLVPDSAFEVRHQAGLIIRFGGREVIGSVVRAGDVIFFKATPIVAGLSWIPTAIRQIAAIPDVTPNGGPATDIYLGTPIEAALIQFVLLPNDHIEVLNPVQGQGVTCVRCVKERDALIAITLKSRAEGKGIAFASFKEGGTNGSPRGRVLDWGEIAEPPDCRAPCFLGRPRSTLDGRICVPVSLTGGIERTLSLQMDGDRPGIPRWSEARTTLRSTVGVVVGADALCASFVPGPRRAILRLERIQ